MLSLIVMRRSVINFHKEKILEFKSKTQILNSTKSNILKTNLSYMHEKRGGDLIKC